MHQPGYTPQQQSTAVQPAAGTPGPRAIAIQNNRPAAIKAIPGPASATPSVIQAVFTRGGLDALQAPQANELEALLKDSGPLDELTGAQATYKKRSDQTATLRHSVKRNFTYRSSTNIDFTFTSYDGKAPILTGVTNVLEGRNLKYSRTDDNDYRWIGDNVQGQLLGMTPSRRVDSEADIPHGYYESHLSGKHGIRYFKKQHPTRMNTAMPGFDALIDSGRDIRYTEAMHTTADDDRDSANTVMGSSATQYAGQLGSIRPDKDERVTGNIKNGISYEWCHLIGHGDGGTEVPENFVAGSHYANTEQLAIETGLRHFRNQGLKLRVWAFFPQVREDITVDAYFADFVTYDILHNGKEIFTHTFSTHSPSFDIREWNMLQADVQNKLGEALMATITPEQITALDKSTRDMIGDKSEETHERLGRSTKNFEREVWGELSNSAFQATHSLKAKAAQIAAIAQTTH